MLRVFLAVVLLIVCQLCSLAQNAEERDSVKPQRLVVATNLNPFFFYFPYVSPHMTLDVRVLQRFTFNQQIGTYTGLNWLKHHEVASGFYGTTSLRYYHSNSQFLSFGVGYSERNTHPYGTFPSSTGYYLKQPEMSTYSKSVTLMYGQRSTTKRRIQLETYLGISLGIDNNHFTGLTPYELLLIDLDKIPEFERIGGHTAHFQPTFIMGLGIAFILAR